MQPPPKAPPTEPRPADLDDAVAPAIRELVAVFTDALAEVKFPDVDGRSLAAGIKQVEERAAELRRLEAAVVEARGRLVDASDQLVIRAQRAIAYARIYADSDVTLLARLDAIALPRPRTARPPTTVAPADAPRPRGRPRKDVERTTTTLFAVADAAVTPQ